MLQIFTSCWYTLVAGSPACLAVWWRCVKRRIGCGSVSLLSSAPIFLLTSYDSPSTTSYPLVVGNLVPSFARGGWYCRSVITGINGPVLAACEFLETPCGTYTVWSYLLNTEVVFNSEKYCWLPEVGLAFSKIIGILKMKLWFHNISF